MLKSYLITAVRSFKSHKLFLFINVLGMGIAIACCIVAYLNWKFNAGWDTNFSDRDRIFRVQHWQEFEGFYSRYGVAPISLGNQLKGSSEKIEHVVRILPLTGIFRINDELNSISLAYADTAFFDVFPYSMKSGNTSDFKNKDKIFISEELEKRFFGTEQALGKELIQIINGQQKEFTVAGVFQNQPMNSSFASDAYVLFENYWNFNSDLQAENDWKQFSILFLQLRQSTDAEAVEKELGRYVEIQNKAREDYKVKNFYLENFDGMAERNRNGQRLRDDWLRQGLPKEAILIPSVMSAFLLLLVCFNFTNTSIALSSRRLKEIALRKIMGGQRSGLIFQFLGENLLWCLIALLVGLFIAEFLVPAYDSMWVWLQLDLSYSNHPEIFIFLTIILLFTALVAGMYPSVYITSFAPSSIFREKLKLGGTNWFSRTLLVLQFFICILTLVFAVAFQQNAYYQENFDLGFDTKGIISTLVRNENEFNTYRNALIDNKDIRVVAGAKSHLLTSYSGISIKYESNEKLVDLIEVGDHYLEGMGMTVIEGRDFKERSSTDQRESVLVSEELVSQLGWDNPIGKQLQLSDTTRVYVIGVIKNVFTRMLWRPVEPLVVRYVLPDQYRELIVSTDPNKLYKVNADMKKKWSEIFPNSLYEGQPVDQVMAESHEINSNVIKMFSFLGIVAVILSVTGLYALVSLHIIKKMKQIGVRKILGGSMGSIAVNIFREFIIILFIASAIAGLSSFYGTNLIMDSIWDYYQRASISGIVLAAGGVCVIAVFAVSFKIYKAISANAVTSLRSE